MNEKQRPTIEGTSPNRYWYKHPGPGQFRGEGTWKETTGENYERLRDTGFLPVHWGQNPPTSKEE